jgi:protein pelota
MRVLKFDRKKGIVRVKIENLTDLWHLGHVLEPCDIVRAKTYRKVTIKRGGEIEYGEKKPLTVTLRLERVEFHKETGKLRLGGMIVEAPDDFSAGHHTIQAEPGLVLTIRKKWRPHQLERIKSARVREPVLLVCLIDRESASFYSLKGHGIDFLGEDVQPRRLKGVEAERIKKSGLEGGFYQKVTDYLAGQEGYEKIVIAGPGFEKENLFNFIKSRNKELASKIILEQVSSATRSGLNELLKKSGDRILQQTRVVRETQKVEKLFGEINRDGLGVYGRDEVKKAITFGALEELLVSEEKVAEYEELMETAEKIGCRIVVISSSHEAGERLLHLGGIGAFLRFRI